jgi:hypothetical protein
VVFTPWPPGPEDLEKRQISSSDGITMPRAVTSMLIALACLSRPYRNLCTLTQWDREEKYARRVITPGVPENLPVFAISITGPPDRCRHRATPRYRRT